MTSDSTQGIGYLVGFYRAKSFDLDVNKNQYALLHIYLILIRYKMEKKIVGANLRSANNITVCWPYAIRVVPNLLFIGSVL
jgi:hypothetical protein